MSAGLKVLTDEEFFIFSNYIEKNLGIQMPIDKKILLQSRLQTRLRVLNIPSFKEYIEYVFKTKEGVDEIVHFTDVITTNKTSFFRENAHFIHLSNVVIPQILETKNHIKIWSAGCSSGEEPYTLCMVMEMTKKKLGKNFTYSVLATDISSRILEKAKRAVYPAKIINDLSEEIKKDFFTKSKDDTKDLVRIKGFLREKVSFNRLNFMDEDFGMERDYDIVFCRNVIIYFDKAMQATVINKLCSHLKEGGTLCLGHSETVVNMSLPLKEIKGPGTTYIKKSN